MKKIIILLLFSLRLYAMDKEDTKAIKLELKRELLLPNSDHAELLCNQDTEKLILKIHNSEKKSGYFLNLSLHELRNITVNELFPIGIALTPCPEQELVITSFGTQDTHCDLSIVFRCPLNKLQPSDTLPLRSPSAEGIQFFHSKSSNGTLEEIKLKLLQNRALKIVLIERINTNPLWLHKFNFLHTPGHEEFISPTKERVYQSK